jgi:phospholipid-binding lipoprotein MlaA
MTSDLPSSSSKRAARLASTLAAAFVVAGCATVSNPNPADPWESYNRSMYTFNDNVDKALLKPIASGYAALTPKPVQTCVHNVYNNLNDIWSAFNSFIQARGHDFFNTLGRFMFNTTMGLGGCIDVASMNGSKRIQNDFGVTLGVWGFESGPYLVLPFFGASSLRDALGTAGEFAGGLGAVTPVGAIEDIPLRNSLIGLQIIDARANLLEADKLVSDVALDRYSFIRDAYLQHREALVRGRNTEAPLPDYSDDEATK